MAHVPSHGLILAGLHSSSGKTAVCCLLLAALQARGVDVQPFKVGPDFIDPGYHSRFGARISRNLDTWLMGEAGVLQEVRVHGAGRVSLVEGVMGLFDGNDVASDAGSAMELSRLLDWPVVLVVPSAKAGRSLAASLRGFLAEAGPGRIAGVILNEVSGASHADYLREALRPLGVPVLGALPRLDALRWPERHLGLQSSTEGGLPSPGDLARLAEEHLDLAAIQALLTPAPPLAESPRSVPARKRIAVARDAAFHFYYPANLDFLRARGVDLVEFSPLRDSALPEGVSGLLLGGGFPEVFAEELAANGGLRRAVREALEDGLPCYAECGGLMWLAEELATLDGTRHPMVGALPGAVEMTPRLSHFGYCLCLPEGGAPPGRGHEFHYSRWAEESAQANLWTVRRKRSGAERREGFTRRRFQASYVHLHFPSSPALLEPFLDADFMNPSDRQPAAL